MPSRSLHDEYRQGAVFPREVSAQVDIDAPIERVWSVLTDLAAYPKWNPFTPRVTGELRVGSPLELHVQMPGKALMVRTEWVNRIDEHRCVCWGMHLGHPMLLTANRWQILRPLPGHRTEYVSTDKFSGLLVPLTLLLYGSAISRGFAACAQALKHAAEELPAAKETSP